MRDLIATVSAHQHRSMHSEIIRRLDDSFEPSDVSPGPIAPSDQQLTASEIKLISEFRMLDQEIQQALLEFIAPQKDTEEMR